VTREAVCFGFSKVSLKISAIHEASSSSFSASNIDSFFIASSKVLLPAGSVFLIAAIRPGQSPVS
jgi:hypothetical protein